MTDLRQNETSAATGSKPPGAVLFLCKMNAIRSPLAEAIARTILPNTTYIASAGIEHGERDPFVDAVLAERGLAVADHGPRRFEDLEDSYFDLIVTLAPEARDAAAKVTDTLSAEVEYWPMPDPSRTEGTRERILEAYRDLCDRIERRIGERFALPRRSGDAGH